MDISAILGKIGFDWQVALANLFNFFIIFFILKRFAFKPIGKMIKERKEAIDKGLEDAEANAKKLKETTEEYEAVLQKARQEANILFEKNKKELEIKKTEILAQTQKEIAEKIEQSKKMIDAERIKMVNEARNEVAGLVLQATEKILASPVGVQPMEEKSK